MSNESGLWNGGLASLVSDSQDFTRQPPERPIFQGAPMVSGTTRSLRIVQVDCGQPLSQRYTDAIARFQQDIAADDDNAGAFIGIGMAYPHAGQTGPAKAAFAEAKRLDPAKANDLDLLIRSIKQISRDANPRASP